MRIRHYIPQDLEPIAELERKHIKCGWSSEVLRQTLESPDTVMLVCEADGTAIGYGSFSKVITEAQINNICVELGFRGRGYGSEILTALEAEAVKRNCGEMTLEVAADNAAARELYRKRGFSDLYTRKQYYGDKDAIVMRKIIKYKL